jgi:hypothetical protein
LFSIVFTPVRLVRYIQTLEPSRAASPFRPLDAELDRYPINEPSGTAQPFGYLPVTRGGVLDDEISDGGVSLGGIGLPDRAQIHDFS